MLKIAQNKAQMLKIMPYLLKNNLICNILCEKHTNRLQSVSKKQIFMQNKPKIRF